MICALEFSYLNKMLSYSELQIIKNHYNKLNLQMNIKKYFKKNNISQIIDFMKSDKKNFDKKINLVLLKKIGSKPIITTFTDKKIRQFLIKKLN